MKNLIKIILLLVIGFVRPTFAQSIYTQTSLENALKLNYIQYKDIGSLTVDAKKEKHLLKHLDKFIRLNFIKVINCDSLPVGIFAFRFVKYIEVTGLNYMPDGPYEKLIYLTKFTYKKVI